MEVRDPMAELAPDTNPDLHDCSEEDWARYRLEQVARLKQRTVECIGGSQVSSSVVGSNVEGMESCTTATLRTKADSVISDVDIWRQYSFDKQDQAWKVPIIDYKDKILECIGGEFEFLFLRLLSPCVQVTRLWCCPAPLAVASPPRCRSTSSTSTPWRGGT